MEAASDPRLPERVGPYVVVSRLAFGGMAELLIGRRVGPSGFMRTVAIKRILPHLAADPDFRSMFLDEARLAAMIQHPNVVRVEDLGEDGDSYYMAMEFLEGETAHALQRASKEPLDPACAAYLVAEAALGLHAAHTLIGPDGQAMSVVHRDVTPQNLFITYDGRVKVIDFGVAHAAQRVTHTQSGVIKGKFAYMSPEQLRDHRVDHRSDQFSLGVVLFELLTRRRLFARSSQGATVHAVVSEVPPNPSKVRSGIPPEIDAICKRVLAKNPAHRYASCADFSAALMEYVGSATDVGDARASLAAWMKTHFDEAIEAKRALRTGTTDVSAVERVSSSISTESPSLHRRRRGRKRARHAMVAAIGMLSLAGAVALWLMSEQSADAREPQPTALDTTPASERAEPVAPTVEDAPGDIFAEITSTPEGAAVTVRDLEGKELSWLGTEGASLKTPLNTRLVPHGETVVVELALEGHEPWTRQVILDVSQRMHANLRAREPDPEETSAMSRRRTRATRGMRATNSGDAMATMTAIPLWD